MQSPPVNMSVVAQAERTWANGSPPTRRAQAARYAAHQPASHDSARAPAGKNGWTTAPASASPSSGATTGAASAFAGTERTGTAPNWSQRTGAVARPHAPETATTPASLRGQAQPSRAPAPPGARMTPPP